MLFNYCSFTSFNSPFSQNEFLTLTQSKSIDWYLFDGNLAFKELKPPLTSKNRALIKIHLLCYEFLKIIKKVAKIFLLRKLAFMASHLSKCCTLTEQTVRDFLK